jgi:hypothetical protein
MFQYGVLLTAATLFTRCSTLPEGDAVLEKDDECADGQVQGECALNALQYQSFLKINTQATCQDAKPGDDCYKEIMWAKTDGIVSHPEWYPGLSASSTDVQFQAHIYDKSPGKCPLPCTGNMPSSATCQDAKEGDDCYKEIVWAKTEGIGAHPEWYPGLTTTSSDADFQALVHQNSPTKCPAPCKHSASGALIPGTPAAHLNKWCEGAPPPTLWPPAVEGGVVQIKILTYNLFWWSLYGIRGGNGNSAGMLIKESMADQPFDVMGFQECESGIRVLEPVGLLEEYDVFQGEHATCLAYYKKNWSLLAKGAESVAEDMKTHYYGMRGAQWVRLEHVPTGRKLLFVNHHGPLEVNSGGECGGTNTAYNLLRLMQRHAEHGDMIILVGDFNANSASTTVQELWSRMVLLQAGDSFGGVDNIFGNMPTASVIRKKTLGSGGSDHDAVSLVVEVGNMRRLSENAAVLSDANEAAKALVLKPPGDDWQSFWCGRLEPDVNYIPAAGSVSTVVEHHPQNGDSQDVASAQRCCRLCQRDPRCKSWTWQDAGPRCVMYNVLPASTSTIPGFISGLPASVAAVVAQQSAKNAITSLDSPSLGSSHGGSSHHKSGHQGR